MFKTLRFCLEYNLLRFGHLKFRNLVIVSDFDIRVSDLARVCPAQDVFVHSAKQRQ